MPGDARPVPMVGKSMTIGRGEDNDLVLPDPDKVVSKNHCTIEDQNGNVVVIDFSTNGTFLNYGKVPLGLTPTPLNDGDILCIGSYELVVDLASEAAPGPGDLPPLGETQVSPGKVDPFGGIAGPSDTQDNGDFLDDLLGESRSPKGHGSVTRPGLDDAGAGADGLLPPLDADDLLGPSAMPDGPAMSQHNPATSDAFRPPQPQAPQIPDDWDNLLDPGAVTRPPQSTQPPTPGDWPGHADMTAPGSHSLPVTGATQMTGGSLMETFLVAADMPELAVAPEDESVVMARVGRIFRIFVEGVRDVLLARSALKSEFRIETTMIAAQGNSPLKFSMTPDMAMEGMLKPSRGFQPPEDAANEALDDIKAHQIAMVTGMEAALKGVLAQLSPEQLETKITDPGGIGAMFKGRKARYWEAYEQLYADIAQQAETDFQELFAREFARAYQAQLQRLKAEARNGGRR
ncbi:Uncharacterized protein ImpI/VasC [Rhodovulum sp. P5]|nr:Uncharacterized protein ImpI/VasC [Rhodovulum sp. P5]